MQIQIDSREHKSELQRILPQLDALGIQYFVSKLFVGDYMSLDNPRLVIDRKKDLNELCNNVTFQHERFKKELLRAREHGIKIVILCEHGEDIKSLEDVWFWVNPRRKSYKWVTVNGKPRRVKIEPRRMSPSGEQLYKSLCTISERYGVEFRFCDKKETGRMIVSILGANHGEH